MNDSKQHILQDQQYLGTVQEVQETRAIYRVYWPDPLTGEYRLNPESFEDSREAELWLRLQHQRALPISMDVQGIHIELDISEHPMVLGIYARLLQGYFPLGSKDQKLIQQIREEVQLHFHKFLDRLRCLERQLITK